MSEQVVLAEQIQAEFEERRKKASKLTDSRDRWRCFLAIRRAEEILEATA